MYIRIFTLARNNIRPSTVIPPTTGGQLVNLHYFPVIITADTLNQAKTNQINLRLEAL